MHRRGFQRPILVGGAAAEFYTTSALTTGDFDICTLRQPELEEELQRLGFVRPSGAGAMLKGWVHPELKLGFEVVADVPMDGSIDPTHLRLVRPEGESALFRIISVEDLIADRMGQYASGSAPDRLSRRACCSLFTSMPTCPILSVASARRAWAIMASKISEAEAAEPVIDMAEFGQRIAARKAALGLPDPPRNAGCNRTPSKRALLKAIEDAGGKW